MREFVAHDVVGLCEGLAEVGALAVPERVFHRTAERVAVADRRPQLLALARRRTADQVGQVDAQVVCEEGRGVAGVVVGLVDVGDSGGPGAFRPCVRCDTRVDLVVIRNPGPIADHPVERMRDLVDVQRDGA